MSIITRTRRRRIAEETTEPAPQPARRKRRRWRLLAAGALLLLFLLWLLPGLVAHTPMLRWLIAQATADLNGKLSVESASLGWFSPIVVRGIEVRDPKQQSVLKAGELVSNKSLTTLLLNPSLLGRFRLENAELHVELRGDGSNLEDLVAKYLEPSDDESSGPISLVLEIVDASVSVTDRQTSESWQIDDLQLSLSLSADASQPIELTASAATADAQHPGSLDLALSMTMPPAKEEPSTKDRGDDKKKGDARPEPLIPGRGELTFNAKAFPLGMLRSIVCRYLPETELAGRLSSQIQTKWTDNDGGTIAVSADLTTDDLSMATPALGTDRVELSHLHTKCKVAAEERLVTVDDASLECDFGEAELAASFDLSDVDPAALLASTAHRPTELHANVDLVRLAQMLPNTLRIRKGTEVVSGHVQMALKSKEDQEHMVWEGGLEAADLKAVYQGRHFTWQRPILVSFAARDSLDGPVVESLKCESDFLNIHTAGTPDDLAASISFDLRQLADQLGQFVDFGGLVLAGDGWGHVNWKRTDAKQFEADVELQVRDFRFVLPEQPAWTEDNVVVVLALAGRTDLAAETQIQDATLQARLGADQIHARLTQPVVDFRNGGTWPVSARIEGHLESWRARLANWFDLGDWDFAGKYDLTIQAAGSTEGLVVRDVRIHADQFRLASSWLNIDEPSVDLVAAGTWDQPTWQLQLKPATLTTQTLNVRADSFAMKLPEDGAVELAGVLQYSGQLDRVRSWFTDPRAPMVWRLGGNMNGTAQLAASIGRVTGQVNVNVDNLVLIASSGERIQEPLVQLAAAGSYENATGALQLEQFEVTSATVGANAYGQAVLAEDQSQVQLAGRIQYDLEKLAALLPPGPRRRIKIRGRSTSPLSVEGPLDPIEARANTAVAWEWAKVYGFEIGPGELKLALRDGLLRAEPLTVAVSGGKAVLTPQVRLAPEPRQLTMAPGPLVSQVQITTEMCQELLQYVAPVLAGVTEAQGGFSIELDGCRVPLEDPAQGDISGRFIIHSVEIAPGPLIRELAVLLGYRAPARLRRESVVTFRMVNGRVEHQGLELQFPDLTVRTRGSVGLDESLALVAEMPIPPKWIGNNALGDALRNETIQLPIGGTLSNPRIDGRALEQLSKRLLQQTTRNAVEEGINRGLEEGLRRLFGQPQ